MAGIVRRVRLVAISIGLTASCGCSLQSLLGSGANAGTDFTGNYSFAAVPNASGQTTGAVQGFTGAIANTGTAFTAVLRLSSATGCVSPSADIAFTGSMESSGQITLTSTALPSNSVTLTWLDDPAQSSNGIGTYAITGSGPCATASTQFVSDQFSPVTGTYTGTLASTTGTQAAVTATLTQGAANADGQFPETGSLVLTTAGCTNNFSVTGLVTGSSLSASFNSGGGAPLGGFAAVLPDHVLTLPIPSGFTVTGACNAGSYSGVLSKQ